MAFATLRRLMLVAAGKMRLPKTSLKVQELLKIPTGRVAGGEAIKTLFEERAEGR